MSAAVYILSRFWKPDLNKLEFPSKKLDTLTAFLLEVAKIHPGLNINNFINIEQKHQKLHKYMKLNYLFVIRYIIFLLECIYSFGGGAGLLLQNLQKAVYIPDY